MVRYTYICETERLIQTKLKEAVVEHVLATDIKIPLNQTSVVRKSLYYFPRNIRKRNDRNTETSSKSQS